MNRRRRIAMRLRFLADRIAPEDAPRRTSISFEFVTHKGIVTNTDGHGCPLWYFGRDDYEKAHERQTAADQAETERLREWGRSLVITPADYQVDAMVAAPLTADMLRAARDARMPDPIVTVHPTDAATFEFEARS